MFYQACPTLGCSASWADLVHFGGHDKEPLSKAAEAFFKVHSRGRERHIGALQWRARIAVSAMVILSLLTFYALVKTLHDINYWELVDWFQ
jgi:hypothetical protein